MSKFLLAAVLAVAILAGAQAQTDPVSVPTPTPVPNPKKPINKKVIKVERATVDNVDSRHGNTVIIAGGGATTVRSINQLLGGLDRQLEDAIDEAIAQDPNTLLDGADLQGKIDAIVNNQP